MPLNAILQYSAACLCVGVVCFALLRERRSYIHWLFALGMCALACEAFFTGLSIQTLVAERAIAWQHWRLLTAALVPGVWLLFALSFTREDGQSLHPRWKWIVSGICVLHLAFVSLWWPAVFREDPMALAKGWAFKLDWAGYGFLMCLMLSMVLILMVFERILRASAGRKRWQGKFFVLGIGGLLAARIYTVSHTLVFHTLNLEFEVINAVALLAANLLIFISLLRAGSLHIDIYLSQKVLYNSFTLIVVGVYFLALGLAVQTLNGYLALPLRALIVFLALLGLVIVLSSDRIRLEIKRFVSRHFRRPHFDYRKVWLDFTARTAALVEEKALCEAVVKLICEMFAIHSVSIWLADANQAQLSCGASTALSAPRACNLPVLQGQAKGILKSLPQQTNVLDLKDLQLDGDAELKSKQVHLLREARIRYLVPLAAGGERLGFISLGDLVKDQPFFLEELDMLRTIADQVAAELLNIKLTKRLHQAREMEAFQTVAAFFVHDLKNLASGLSMMMKNFRVHFDNPDFREDALRLMARNVDQVESLCRRLSSVREKLEIQPVATDLNQVVAATLDAHNGLPAASLVENLNPVPKVWADPEQIQKVLVNLILNAADAVGEEGKICISSATRDGWVEIGVSDTGCGISKEFLSECLFQPFKTTKPQGTGIGLFQSKMIVEAHNGVIEVESQEGRGSTFRVLLPLR